MTDASCRLCPGVKLGKSDLSPRVKGHANQA